MHADICSPHTCPWVGVESEILNFPLQRRPHPNHTKKAMHYSWDVSTVLPHTSCPEAKLFAEWNMFACLLQSSSVTEEWYVWSSLPAAFSQTAAGLRRREVYAKRTGEGKSLQKLTLQQRQSFSEVSPAVHESSANKTFHYRRSDSGRDYTTNRDLT